MNGKILAIIAVVGGYWTVSIAMVFANKALVSGRRMHSDISILLVWCQNLIGVVVLVAMRCVDTVFESSWLDLPELQAKTLLQNDLLLASGTYTAMLVTNNMMLRHISVSFYQIARSLNMIFVIILSSIILQQRTALKVAIPCVLIMLGFCLGVKEEIYLSRIEPFDVVYGVTTSFLGALSGVFCKRLQRTAGITSLQFTYYNFVISTVALTPVVLMTSQINDLLSSTVVFDLNFWFLLLVSGVAGLCMGWITTLQISLTSPLTHIISTNAKSGVQTVLAVIWFHERRSLTWWAGNLLVVGGAVLYTVTKLKAEQHDRIINHTKHYERVSRR